MVAAAGHSCPAATRPTDVPGTLDYERLAAVTAATTAAVVSWADDGRPV